MTDKNIKIVNLEPMKFVRFSAFSASPEAECISKLEAWAKPRGLLDERFQHRIFGYSNPCSQPGETEYRYDFLIDITGSKEPVTDMPIEDFDGGLYAVTRVKGVTNIGPGWQSLVNWVNQSKYQIRNELNLEEHVGEKGESDEELILDLLVSLQEK